MIVLLLCLNNAVFSQTAIQPLGMGTIASPYQIESLENLYWISQNPAHFNKYYLQTSNIDASSTSGWFSGAGWQPIGIGEGNEFTGQYNGNGYIISGLFINRQQGNIGLFGYTKNATIINLGLENVDITGTIGVGGIAGDLWLSNIYNCYTTGNITCIHWMGVYTGGLVGLAHTSTIKNSYSKALVSSEQSGWGWYTGGIVGFSHTSIIENCYSVGEVTGNDFFGGLIGYNAHDSEIINSFWDKEASGALWSSGGDGKTSAEMKDIETFIEKGWDFKGLGEFEIWNIGNGQNDGYPYFNLQYPADPAITNTLLPTAITYNATNVNHSAATLNGKLTNTGIPNVLKFGFCWNTTSKPTINDNYVEFNNYEPERMFSHVINDLIIDSTYFVRAFATNNNGTRYGNEISFMAETIPAGAGTIDDPMLISSLSELYWIAQNPGQWNKHYMQTSSIDATITKKWNDEKGWAPIGTMFDNEFRGSYNGNGYAIKGLYIDRPYSSMQGLFGFANGAVLYDVHLFDASVNGQLYVGSLSGGVYTTEVINCSANGSVTGLETVGVLIGSTSNDSFISNCFSKGSATGTWYVGGLTGDNWYSEISNSYSNANVDGYSYVGGLVGDHYDSSILNCYSSGEVVADDWIAGGLVGDSYDATISNSYYDMETSGQNDYNGEGKTTAEMKMQETFADWDFDNTWNIIENATYPFFEWQKIYIQASSGQNGSINPSGFIEVPFGSVNVSIIITPDEGYKIASIIIDNNEINMETDINWNSVNNSYTFPILFENRSIHANFGVISSIENNLNAHANILTYPNPFSDFINIQNCENVYRIVITNLTGQRIIDIENSDRNFLTIQTTDLKSGFYCISFYLTNDTTIMKKVVKH